MPAEPPFEPLADPDAVATKSFSSGFRGFDQSEVRAYLTSLASALRAVSVRQDDLVLRLSVAEQRARSTAELEPAQLTALLGEETARVLESARTAAAEIRAKAQEAANRRREEAEAYAAEVRALADSETAQIRADAEAYATEVRGSADTDTGQLRTATDLYSSQVREDADAHAYAVRAQAETASHTMRDDADSYAADVRARADADVAELRTGASEDAQQLRAYAEAHAAQLRTEAAEVLGVRIAEAEAVAAQIRAEAEQVLSQAEDQAAAEVELGRQQGRELVARAETQRDDVTREIGRRRRAARQQLEQVSAARERLLEAYRTVRDLADRATDELDVALPEARAAAEAAGQTETQGTEAAVPDGASVPSEPPPPVPDQPPAHEEQGSPVSIFGHSQTAPRELAPEPLPDHDPGSGSGSTGGAGGQPVVYDRVDEAPEEAPSFEEHERPSPTAAGGREAEEPVAEGPAVGAPVTGPPVADIDALFARIRATAVPARPSAGNEKVVARSVDVTDGSSRDRQALGAADPASGASVAQLGVDIVAAPAGEGHNRDEDKESGAVQTLLERRDAAAEKVERSLARKLKRVLADEQNTVLDSVRRTKRPQFSSVLPDDEQHLRRYAEVATEDLATAASAGRHFYGEMVRNHAGGGAPANGNGNGNGVTIVVDSGVVDLAQALAAELVSQVRERVQRCFNDGETDSGGPDDEVDEAELSDRIRACYRDWKTQRIVDLARHFVFSAFSRGAYDAAPAGACLAWVIDNGGTPCPDAEDNALAGAQTKGEPFPTGQVYPPAHPGCRCLVVPEEVLAEVKAPVPHR